MSSVAVWGDFEVDFARPLGRGGMGAVYRARQASLGREVAVKVLDPQHADPALRAGILEKFRREIRALALLHDPRIVAIIQAGENDGRLWFAMELVEGRTLDRRLQEEGSVPEPEARRIAAELARALEAALRAGIIHRDVKPANVFLGKDGAVKLGDFGLARSDDFARTRITEANALACTPAYASPEQADGRDCDHRSDLYSLGAVLYEMVTERPPFPSESPLEALRSLASDRPTSVRLLNPSVSSDLERVILRCLEKNPDDRYPTYGALLADLEPSASQPRREWVLPAAAAAGLAVLGAILAAVFMTEPSPPPVAVRVEPIVVPIPAPEPAGEPPPLPVVREPSGEPTFGPPRDARLPEAAPALERPSRREIDMAGRLLALSRESLEARTAYEFDRALSRLAAFVKREEPGPWARRLADAEEERLRAAASLPTLRAGTYVSLALRSGRVLDGRLVAADREEVAIELASGLRETFPLSAVAPSTFGSDLLLARAGAGDARGVMPGLDKLGERHAAGVVDQAIEEALRGDLQDLAAFRIPDGLRDSLEFVLSSRFRLLDEESEAARLHLAGDFATLLLERPLTRAGTRAARASLDEFRKSIPEGPDFELVGEVPWGTWATEGAARFDAAAGTYSLQAARADQRAWIRKPFRGARKGYEVRFRLLEAARLSVALSFTRWFELSPEDFVLFVAGREEEAKEVRRVALGRRLSAGVVAVVPRAPLVLVYLDGSLLAALPETDFALGDGMQLGAGGGGVVLESIRVKDRTR